MQRPVGSGEKRHRRPNASRGHSARRQIRPTKTQASDLGSVVPVLQAGVKYQVRIREMIAI